MDEKSSLWEEISENKLSDISATKILIDCSRRRTIQGLYRLTFVKNLYAGDTLKEVAARVGKSESTGSQWARCWNEGGLGQLTPNFGGGCPPKLGEDEQEQLNEMLRGI